jgi:hypothetical protein
MRRQRKPRISTAGQRKIVNDKEIEIPIKNFSSTDSIVGTDADEELDLNAKRSYIDSILKDNSYIREEIAQTLMNVKSTKRQKTAPPTPLSDEYPELEHSGEESERANVSKGDFDEGIELDFGWDDEPMPRSTIQDGGDELPGHAQEGDNVDEFNSNSAHEGISEATETISSHLGDLFKSKPVATFTDIIEKNSLSTKPLSSIPKSEATRVFFELLVLGTGDAIELKQEELFGEIQVKPRQNLFQKFL